MPIKLLDERLINKIAAGEVVERPASVVKELIENSLDAGSKRIDVRIGGGGIDLIEVSDDGEGISEAELPMAFLRHATSKISGEEDLFNIITMGFRGEALPSILSVSRMEIYTRCAAQNGFYARLEGGCLLDKHPQASPTGSKIIVRDLFYNTPARKKFLRSSVSEGNHVYELVCRYAMARPDVAFTYSNDKRSFFKTAGNGSLRDAVASIWGVDILEHMLDVEGEQGTYKLAGLTSSSEIHRQSRKNQIFYVNRRPVRSPMLYRALDTAYKGLLLAREQPIAILDLTLPVDEVDVNVHPQKSEVRFRDEKRVFSTMVEVLGEALGRMRVSPDWKRFENMDAQHRQFVKDTAAQFDFPQAVPELWNRAVIQEDVERKSLWDLTDPQLPHPADEKTHRIIGQSLDTYIVMEMERELWLIDQHAAHERIMYWRIKNNLKQNPGQVLLIPLAVEFSTRQMEIIEGKQSRLRELGFGLEPLGHNSMLLREAPAILAGREIEVLLELADIEEDAGDYEEKAVIMMACKKAVKSGMPLPREEIEGIVKELFSVPDFRFCPHGRPTMIKLSKTDLDRMFKRLQ